jgi:cytidine deaminase
MTIDTQGLVRAATSAAAYAYSPYSHFRVGAALLCQDGTIVTGTNIENRSFGLTICAERSAIAAAIGMGKKDFIAIAVYSPDSTDPLPPCGACRQVLSEFSVKDLIVIMAGSGSIAQKTIAELYPFDSLHELADRT